MFIFQSLYIRVTILLESAGQKDGHPHALPLAQERSAELQRGCPPLFLLFVLLQRFVFPINLLHRRSLWGLGNDSDVSNGFGEREEAARDDI